MKKRKWLKARRRANKIKKQINYLSKTHKGTDKFTLQGNLNKKKEIAKPAPKVERKHNYMWVVLVIFCLAFAIYLILR